MFTEWLRSLSTPEPPPSPKVAPIVIGSWNGMTQELWARSPDHINYARALFQTPKFRDLLSVLSNLRATPVYAGLSDTDAAIQYGIRLGHDQMLGVLLGLPNFPQEEPMEVPADYGAADFSIDQTR